MIRVWSRRWTGRSSRSGPRIRALVTACEEGVMNLDYLLGGALTVALTIYLVYALLAPEKF